MQKQGPPLKKTPFYFKGNHDTCEAEKKHPTPFHPQINQLSLRSEVRHQV